MKKRYLYVVLTAVVFGLFNTSCDKDLPFPIDEVTRGVVIDIVRVSGTNGVLSDGVASGDYKLAITIPVYQGDYSMMDHAQLSAVLNDGKTTTARVAVDNITTFPTTLTLNIADVYSKFGKSAPSLGETLNFTMNVVMKDGSVIPGWNQYTGVYNNQSFSGWLVDGRSYSNRVQYSVVCPFDPETTFIGAFQCTESSQYGNDQYDVELSYYDGKPATVPAGVDPNMLYGIKIDPISPNIWEPAITHAVIWLNREDFSVIAPDFATGDFYSNGTEIVWRFSNTSISSCTRQIRFTGTPMIPGTGNYAAISFTIAPK